MRCSILDVSRGTTTPLECPHPILLLTKKVYIQAINYINSSSATSLPLKVSHGPAQILLRMLLRLFYSRLKNTFTRVCFERSLFFCNGWDAELFLYQMGPGGIKAKITLLKADPRIFLSRKARLSPDKAGTSTKYASSRLNIQLTSPISVCLISAENSFLLPTEKIMSYSLMFSVPYPCQFTRLSKFYSLVISQTKNIALVLQRSWDQTSEFILLSSVSKLQMNWFVAYSAYSEIFRDEASFNSWQSQGKGYIVVVVQLIFNEAVNDRALSTT